MHRRFVLALLVATFVAGAIAPSLDAQSRRDDLDDLDRLLDGVTEIAKPGVPGPVVVCGEDAFAVVLGEIGGGARRAVVAATNFGDGRVVCFGHGGYLGRAALNVGQTGRLLQNAVVWSAGGDSRRSRSDDDPPRIALIQAAQATEFLTQAGVDGLFEAPDWQAAIDQGADAIVTNGHLPRDADGQERLREWIQSGGGLVTAGLAWGWQQLNPAKDVVVDYHQNQILRPMGLVFGDGYIDRPVPVADPIDRDALSSCHARRALRLVQRADAATPEDAIVQATGVVVDALRSLPADDETFFADVARIARRVPPVIPTPEAPVRARDGLQRLALVVRHIEAQRADADDVEAAPSAASFPGEVSRRARRVNDEAVEIDLGVPGWASTGLYAEAGRAITVTVPEDAVGLGLAVRIGCHHDTLWNKDEWRRHPEVTAQFPLREVETEVASPHGGLVYVVVPGKLGDERAPISVTIDDAVRAPWFVLGRTDVDDWRRRIREYPAPWAELATLSITLTVPSRVIRDLDDPTDALETWDRIMQCYAELGREPLARRPQRITPDVQISAGYMHSGYPIMTHLDVEARFMDADHLRDGNWGFFHELGHNHQRSAWTFDGTTEVTCNLFTLYVYERVCGKSIREARDFDGVRWREYIDGDATFDRWKRDPFLALYMYIQVIEVFGWEALQDTFQAYTELPADQQPRNDADKHDLWLTTLSRTVDRDLSEFFRRWKVPVSDAAVAALADLETWLPDELSE